MSTLLLDAGVWLAARDADDRHHEPARQLIDADDGPQLAALDLTFYEVANVAVRAWRAPERARIVARLVHAACSGGIAMVDDELVHLAISLAEDHGLSLYDAAYVAAAGLHEWTLVSTDEADLVQPGLAITPEAAVAG